MGEFNFIAHLKDDPAAMVVLIVLIIYKSIDLIIKHIVPLVFPFFKKNRGKQAQEAQPDIIEDLVKKLEKIEAFNEKDEIERKKRQEEVDRRLDAQYEYIREAALQSGIAVIWATDGVPLVESFRAGLLNIKLGANGNLKEKLVEIIIKNPNGRTVWKSVLSAYKREHCGAMGDHFNETIEWIEKRIT